MNIGLKVLFSIVIMGLAGCQESVTLVAVDQDTQKAIAPITVSRSVCKDLIVFPWQPLVDSHVVDEVSTDGRIAIRGLRDREIIVISASGYSSVEITAESKSSVTVKAPDRHRSVKLSIENRTARVEMQRIRP